MSAATATAAASSTGVLAVLVRTRSCECIGVSMSIAGLLAVASRCYCSLGEMPTVTDRRVFSGPVSPAIAAAAGLGLVRKWSRLVILEQAGLAVAEVRFDKIGNGCRVHPINTCSLFLDNGCGEMGFLARMRKWRRR